MGWSNRRPCSCASASTEKVSCTRCAAFGNGTAQLRASAAGEISIRDVRLCIAALDSASSPFRIKQATVSTDATCCAAPSQSTFAQRSRAFVPQVGLMSISIPWWNPYTQPLIVTLDQVVLLRIQYRSYAPILRGNPTRETPASNAPSPRSHPRLLASTLHIVIHPAQDVVISHRETLPPALSVDEHMSAVRNGVVAQLQVRLTSPRV